MLRGEQTAHCACPASPLTILLRTRCACCVSLTYVPGSGTLPKYPEI
jgi:hypothetical protein